MFPYLWNPHCCVVRKKDTWSRDGHLTNITNRLSRKDGQFMNSHSDRHGFKNCAKLTNWDRAKNIIWQIWLFFKSTHLVHPCTPHHSGTPLENSGTPWGVRYTRLTSTGLQQVKWPQIMAKFHTYGRLLHHTQYAGSRWCAVQCTMHATALQQLWIYDSFDYCWFVEHCTISLFKMSRQNRFPKIAEALSYSAVHEIFEGAHFTFSLPGGGAHPWPPVSYVTAWILTIFRQKSPQWWHRRINWRICCFGNRIHVFYPCFFSHENCKRKLTSEMINS